MGNVALTKVVFPDWRGPVTATAGNVSANRNKVLVALRLIIKMHDIRFWQN